MSTHLFLESCESAPQTTEVVFRRFEPLIRKLIRKHAISEEMREELVGIAYVICDNCCNDYDATRGVPIDGFVTSRLRHGIFGAVRAQLRYANRIQALPQDSPENYIPKLIAEGIADGLLEELDRGVDITLCLTLIERMPAGRRRNILVWRYFYGMTDNEIGKATNVAPATVRSQLRHALNYLKQQLALHRA